MTKRILAMLLAVSMLVGLIPAVMARSAPEERQWTATAQEMDSVPTFEEEEAKTAEPEYPQDAMVTVIVELTSAPVLEKAELPTRSGLTAGAAVAEYLASQKAQDMKVALRAQQAEVQESIAEILDAKVETLASWTNLVNGFALTVPYSALAEIKALPNVKRAYVQHTHALPEEPKTIGSEDAWYGYSYDMVGLGETWAEGYTGTGMLVAILDTGLDLSWSYWNDDAGNHIGVRHVHEAFTEDSFRSESAKENLRYTEETMQAFLESHNLFANSQYNRNDGIYKNAKVPFAYDYAGTIDYDNGVVYGDVNVYPGIGGSEHGTHVAGTVAGYAETQEGEVSFSGVAPDAQLAIFKVFPDDGGSAAEICVINAAEDAVAIGADVLNMSFGSDNGFAFDDTAEAEAFTRVREAGVLMMTSAGNADYASSNNNYGGEALAENPETSMMSAPAAYPTNMAVASINNTVNTQSQLSWYVDGVQQASIPFTDSTGVAMKYQFAGKSPVKMILVDGVGTYDDYYNAGFRNYYGSGERGVSGVALVKRGEISFADKVQNASQFLWSYYSVSQGKTVTECPVKAVIVYDNDPAATELITMSTGDYTSVTCAFISGVDGAAIAAALAEGKNVTMNVDEKDAVVPFNKAGEISEFSSWGAGPGLELKPEITAPGGNIYSSVFDQTYNYNAAGQYTDYKGDYAMMSGTSMASPHMTGITALVEQYLRQGMGITNQQEIADLASHLMVSTAVPQMETEDAFWSPRVQGAGLVNVHAAITSPAYISVEGMNVGKLELLDDPERTGTYDLTFQVGNLTNEALTYAVRAYVQRPDSGELEDGRKTMAYTDILLADLDLGSVTVPAGGSATVSKTLTLTEEQKADIDALFENGCYVEGFITLTAENVPTIGLPFMGFYGDWTSAPIFDSALWFHEPEDGESVWNNDCSWDMSDVGCLEPGSGVPVLLGQNYFDPTTVGQAQNVFHKENFTLSPNGDGVLDQIDIFELYQLRQARLVVTEVRDADTGELYFHDYVDYLSMTTYSYAYGYPFPWSLSYFTPTYWAGTDLEGNLLPSGTNCVMTISAYGDGDYGEMIYIDEAGRYVTDFDRVDPTDPSTLPTFNGHAMDMTGNVISFPVVVDTVAPKLKNNAVTFYEKDGRTYITGTIEDVDGSIASVELLPYVARSYASGIGDPNYMEYGIDKINPFYSNNVYDAGTKTLTFTADVTEYHHTVESYPGENYYYSYTWSGNLVLCCGDYGVNDRTYVLHVDSTEGLILSQTSALLHVGDSFDLSVNDNTGSEGLPSVLTRTSSNESVVTVDEFGHVEALAVGQAVITVSNGTSSAICVVAVEDYNTELLDFSLSLDHFEGLKPDGALIVSVTNLQPADVAITENRWEVFEDDEDWAGLLNVEKYSSDGLTGMLYLNYAFSEDLIPAGSGHLTVTINGVSRTMTFNWEDVYQEQDAEGLVGDMSWQGEQTVYVTQGETAVLAAKYRNASAHSFSLVRLYSGVGALNYATTNTTEPAPGLILDGPTTFMNGGTWEGKLVNEEGYALPESVKVFTRYSDGYETEATEGYYRYGVSYEYDAADGSITVWNCPYGASNELVIRADGVEMPGAPAGELSGEEYEIPEGVYGPFNWAATEGYTLTGELTTAENVDTGTGSLRNIAYYTPAEPGISYITATTKDGQHTLNLAVVSLPVKAQKINVEEKHASVHIGDTLALSAELSPLPSLEEDRALTWTSFDESVASVDENGVVTGVFPGFAYVKVHVTTECTVQSYAIVEVTDHVWGETEVEVPATCTQPGSGKHTCTICGAEETVEIAPLDCASTQFKDVPANAWYHDAVDYVVGNGIMNGMGNGTFAPKGTMTRAQLAQVLYNLAGKPEVTAQNPFNDVKETFWGRDAIVWASANGIVNGVGGGKFDPNANVTRETVVVMLYRYAKAEPVAKDYLSSCPDGAKVSSWAKEAMNWAVSNGFIKGDEKGQLNPRKTMTRAEVAQFMMNYLAN